MSMPPLLHEFSCSCATWNVQCGMRNVNFLNLNVQRAMCFWCRYSYVMSVAGVLGFALAVFVLWWVWSRWKEVTRQQDTPFEPAVEHFNYEYEMLHHRLNLLSPAVCCAGSGRVLCVCVSVPVMNIVVVRLRAVCDIWLAVVLPLLSLML